MWGWRGLMAITVGYQFKDLDSILTPKPPTCSYYLSKKTRKINQMQNIKSESDTI